MTAGYMYTIAGQASGVAGGSVSGVPATSASAFLNDPNALAEYGRTLR